MNTLKVFILCFFFYNFAHCNPLLVHISLAKQQDPKTILNKQSLIIEDRQGTGRMDDLEFDIKAQQALPEVTLHIKIFLISNDQKILVASPQFTTRLQEPAHLAIERDGAQLELTFVTVEV